MTYQDLKNFVWQIADLLIKGQKDGKIELGNTLITAAVPGQIPVATINQPTDKTVGVPSRC